MNELVAKYFAEKEQEGCWGGHAAPKVREAVDDFAAWLESAQQSVQSDTPNCLCKLNPDGSIFDPLGCPIHDTACR